ncbi:T9SS type A sorting domain-containing protein [Rhodonellum sp.]|uniref:T9SS type A sorting domain-containing protein n=1 Tax=Rhodonellum sp. TaxID=2231180 RepID=UPI0027288FF5|nr:T9SS type A sorting domain-containing protein [Rhodonellum sp.]MDO9553247.1 T9SS type A sorting domain-containing protein [Rhodonellum sp.]
MKKAIAIFLLNFLLVAFSGSWKAFAQFSQLPTPERVKAQKTKNQNLKIKESPLNIPFWDDFSADAIDTAKWMVEGVTKSNTVGNSPPSLGVLLLDGVDNTGKPYANAPTAQGLTDRITSKPIDLSNLTSQEANTLFLSFYWQAGGKAELPDARDELTLLFLDGQGIWTEVWSQAGGFEDNQQVFTPETIAVPPSYQHAAFQFRFQARGRSSGPFDSWLLDYVFLNKDRSANASFFDDRSLTSTNDRPFEKHSAVPLFELKRNPERYWAKTRNEFNNLSNRFRAMEFTVEIRERDSQAILQKINNNTPFNPVPLALERRSFSSNDFLNIKLPDTQQDWEILTYLSSGDEFLFKLIDGDTLFFDAVDYRVNDTVRTTLPLRDYFAYDNGSVDYSAGINQRSGMLAVRYEIDELTYLRGISINFTNFNQVGRGVDLMVWNDLDEPPVIVKEILIPESRDIQEFSFFEFDTNVQVNDIFFVGFMQFTNDFIHVGLDKTKDNATEIFYNVSGSWQQNESVTGSLMIRAHLNPEAPVTEESEAPPKPVAYPNPVEDKLFVEGVFDSIVIYDSFGRILNLASEDFQKGKIINFAGLQKGVYLIKLINNKEQTSIRILVK